MSIRPERTIPAGSTLVTGHFFKKKSYFTQRAQGSNDWLIIDTIAGGGIFTSSRGTFTVRAGDVVLLRPGNPHDYRTDPGMGTWELVWAHMLLSDAWLDLITWPEPVPGLLHLHVERAAHREITACLDTADACSRTSAAHSERLALNAIERALLLLARSNPNEAAVRLDPRLRAAMDHALCDLSSPPTMEALARSAGMSPSRFAHSFREQVGDSPGRWLENERLRRAAALLDATTRTVADIGAEVGFTDPFLFFTALQSLGWKESTRMAEAENLKPNHQPAVSASPVAVDRNSHPTTCRI